MLAAQSSDGRRWAVQVDAGVDPAGRGLAIDGGYSASRWTSPCRSSSGLTGDVASPTTLDLTFLRHIPANTALVIQGTYLTAR